MSYLVGCSFSCPGQLSHLFAFLIRKTYDVLFVHGTLRLITHDALRRNHNLLTSKNKADKALVLYEQVLGPSHPRVAQCLHNLALLYYAQGRYLDAEPLWQRALALRERALGPDHPDVEVVRQNYLALLRATERHEEAEQLETRARTGQARPPRAGSA